MSNKKFNTDLCSSNMTFEECELTLLRHAIDETSEIKGREIVSNNEIKKMITIVESFLIHKRLLCYGGTAINNILPKEAQFYNRETEIPDYDFYSTDALNDTKELADIYFNSGFTEVEAKSGVHKNTYKVFVNFIPIADITYLNPEIYENLSKEAITVMGIRYCPPNYLRMAMYLELSRPAGDVSRWEKVFKRLVLLNKYHPFVVKKCNKKGNLGSKENGLRDDIYSIIKNSFIEQGVVFFGGYAEYLYSKYIPKSVKTYRTTSYQFDVLSETPEKTALIIKESLDDSGVENINIVHHESIQDVIPEHIEIIVNGQSYAYIYKPIACHSYNTVQIDGKNVNIASIDTMLSFYLAFIYVDKEYYDKDRILCIAKKLFEIEEHNRLKQKGVLKRFITKCYGSQKGLAALRAEKSEMFKKLSKKRNSKEFEEWFLKYIPSQLSKKEIRDRSDAAKDFLKDTEINEKSEEEENMEEEKEDMKPEKRKGKEKGKKSEKKKSEEENLNGEKEPLEEILIEKMKDENIKEKKTAKKYNPEKKYNPRFYRMKKKTNKLRGYKQKIYENRKKTQRKDSSLFDGFFDDKLKPGILF